jgi:hypothetical protein
MRRLHASDFHLILGRMSDIERRKREHIAAVLSGQADHDGSAGFDGVS